MPITTLDGIVAGNLPPEEFLKIGAGTQVIGRPLSLAYASQGTYQLTAATLSVT